MLDKVKQAYQLKKMQSDIQKLISTISVFKEKGKNQVVVTGDKKITKLVVNGVESKDLAELINDAMKEADKKIEKEVKDKQEDLRKLMGL
jgi:DNA-binding protein YbaB